MGQKKFHARSRAGVGDVVSMTGYLRSFLSYPVLDSNTAFFEKYDPFERVHTRVRELEARIKRLRDRLAEAGDDAQRPHLQNKIATAERWLGRFSAERDRLAEPILYGNIRFVAKIVSPYASCGVPVEDLTQEGVFGLIAALHRFDRRRGVRFTTYASWWIRAAVRRYVAEHGFGRLVHVPPRRLQAIRSFQAAEETFRLLHGRNPSDEELWDFMGANSDTPQRVREGGLSKLRRLRAAPSTGKCSSLQLPLDEEDARSMTREDIIVAESLTPEQSMIARDVLRGYREQLAEVEMRLQRCCSERNAKLFKRRIGFDGKPAKLRELAVEFGISHARVGQIVKQTYKQLGLGGADIERLLKVVTLLEELVER